MVVSVLRCLFLRLVQESDAATETDLHLAAIIRVAVDLSIIRVDLRLPIMIMMIKRTYHDHDHLEEEDLRRQDHYNYFSLSYVLMCA